MRFFSYIGCCPAGHQWEEFHYLCDFDYGGFGLLTEKEKIPGYVNAVGDDDFDAVRQILKDIPAFLRLSYDESTSALQFIYGVVFDKGVDGTNYRIDRPRCKVCGELSMKGKYNEDRFLNDICTPERNTWQGLTAAERRDVVGKDFAEYLGRMHRKGSTNPKTDRGN